MLRPLALCIEDLDAEHDDGRYLQCVAKAGRGDGLGIGQDGAPCFGLERPAFELVVSMDERLLLIRHEGAPAIVVQRAGRTLEAPTGARVVLVDGDTVTVGERRLRVHIHGFAPEVHPPRPLVPRGIRQAASVAAVVAVGAVTTGCDEVASIFSGGPIDVRTSPPEPLPLPPEASPPATATPSASAAPIEVRNHPPK